MKWTKVVKTGGIEVNFMGVDLSTIMFTMERGQDVSEVFFLFLYLVVKFILFSR